MGLGEPSNFELSDMAWSRVRHAACMQPATGVQRRSGHMHERSGDRVGIAAKWNDINHAVSSLHVLCESFMICKSSWPVSWSRCEYTDELFVRPILVIDGHERMRSLSRASQQIQADLGCVAVIVAT
jgi:hypothetical protein